MSAPAAAAASSVVTPAAAAVSSSHSALAFFDSHPGSFPNLLQSSDRAWFARGHSQLASALGLPIGSFDELQPSSVPAAASSGGWLNTAAAEQEEVETFVDFVRQSKKLIREIVEVLPPAVYAECAHIASAELHDFSPAGRVDDEIFEKHRDVWEKITRGCAALKISTKSSPKPIWRWAVRANRKFTGHEDDATVAADAKLYCVPGVADSVVVSHKCNGSVLHLASRDIEADGIVSRWTFLGSKKVHVACTWRNVDDWLAKMQLFKGDRFAYVTEMTSFIRPHLKANAQYILDTLARFRLVVNAEYVSSIGTGPTDNELIYGLASDAREAFAFMLTVNQLVVPNSSGCELGLDMMAGLRILNKMGFKTVSAFSIPLSELPAAKVRVVPLPDIEGAVLYYSSSAGLVQLEKWKSCGYVVLRAVREKLKPFIFGGKTFAGLSDMVEKLAAEEARSSLSLERKTITPAQLQAEAAAQPKVKTKKNARQRKRAAQARANAAAEVEEEVEALAIEDGSAEDGEEQKEEQKDASIVPIESAEPIVAAIPAHSALADTYLEFSHPELDLIGSSLQPLHFHRVSAGRWRVACPSDAAIESQIRQTVQSQYHCLIVRKPIDSALSRVLEKVQGRIKSIDHIPMTDEERQAWLDESCRFLHWLTKEIAEKRRWPAKSCMEMYSKLWTIFRQEQQTQ